MFIQDLPSKTYSTAEKLAIILVGRKLLNGSSRSFEAGEDTDPAAAEEKTWADVTERLTFTDAAAFRRTPAWTALARNEMVQRDIFKVTGLPEFWSSSSVAEVIGQ
jgi:hypothetical protein